MRIVNKVSDVGYTQWISDFVGEVIKDSKLKCKEVTIEDIEEDKRIFILIDGKDYNIRTWNFAPCTADESGLTCAEIVSYTLFEMVYEEDGNGYGIEISNGWKRIDWKN